MNASSPPLLSVSDLHVHYGKSHILHGVSFGVGRNEVVSLLGRNGSGRSTTMKAVMGLVPPTGGEQQMLTICRSLLGNPLVMLIDEPTEGLAPKIVVAVADCIRDMVRRGVSVVLVEQKLAIALKVSTRVCVMGHGQIVFEGTPQELSANERLVAEWLAV